MKFTLLVLATWLIPSLTFAHNPNEAFFSYTQKETVVEVKAEFPWSIRNALIEYDSSLVTSKRKIDFEEAFKRYIQENLILTDDNNQNLLLDTIQEVKNNGHSHQNQYLFTFIGNNVERISNTVMFNAYDNQKNYNTVILKTKNIHFQTNINNASYQIKESNLTVYWSLFFLACTIATLVFWLNKD